jgi:cell division protein FtsB
MLEKLRTYFETKNITFFVFALIAFSLSWSTVKVIQRNYDLQQQVRGLEDEVSLLELENSNLKLNIEYYKTDAFLELEARAKFNKADRGESVVLLPKDINPEIAVEEDLTKVTPLPEERGITANFNSWLDFLTARSDAN